MKAIICKNDARTIINNLQDYVQKNSILKGIHLVDETEQQVVILISKEAISQDFASVWWSGYTAGLGGAA